MIESGKKRFSWIFPGQGAQYCGMGRDFYEAYPVARQVFEEADDILKRDLSSIIFNGPEETLTETSNTQTGIFVTSMAIFRVIQEEFPELTADAAGGLSLGEYTAVAASGRLTFAECLPLVQFRGKFMHEACERTDGAMAVVMGMDAAEVEEHLEQMNLPNDLWAANFNCPGQVVISGTRRGVEMGSKILKETGAKRVLPLPVHGAFHSGLMQEAEDRLAEKVSEAPLKDSPIKLVSNVTGTFVEDLESLRVNLIKQVTHPVRWESCVHSLTSETDCFLEMGCGKTLGGMNKRILKGLVPTVSVEKCSDLKALEAVMEMVSA